MTMTMHDGALCARPDQTNSVNSASLSRADQRALIGFLVALLVIRLLFMLWLPLTDSTEARYAEIARKMVETGDWITPQFDYGVPFWGKPPLHTWLSALGMKAFGVGAFGARIFILVTTMIVLGLLFGWARSQRGTGVALATVAVCASSVLFFGAAAFVMTDMVMVLGATLSMLAFHRSVTGADPSRVWGHLFFVGLAIGLLAKGPTAVVLTGIPIFLWLAIGWRWRLLARLPWLTGLAITVALTAPWYLAAEIKTPGFLRYFLIGEHIERFLVPGWDGDLYGTGHDQPKGMIWLFAAGVFLPWTAFAATLAVSPGKVGHAIRASDDGWLGYLALWSLSPLLLFTPAANILPAYVLPGVPAMSLLLVALWSDIFGLTGEWTRRAAGATMIAIAALFAVITVTVQVAPDRLRPRTMDALVARVSDEAPDAQLMTFPMRSYGAEFYSRGTARVLDDPTRLSTLKDNGSREAIIVPTGIAQSTLDHLGPTFAEVARTPWYALLLERDL